MLLHYLYLLFIKAFKLVWGMGGGRGGSTPLELAIKLALINFSKWVLMKAQKSGINKVAS